MELTHKTVLSILPDRDPYAHKGDFGKILLLCGSRGYTGAAERPHSPKASTPLRQ